jgi:hypothetical protein
MNLSSRWNKNRQEKPKYSERTCPNATFSNRSPTLHNLGSNRGLYDGKPATNRLNYGTAFKGPLVGLKFCLLHDCYLLLAWLTPLNWIWRHYFPPKVSELIPHNTASPPREPQFQHSRQMSGKSRPSWHYASPQINSSSKHHSLFFYHGIGPLAHFDLELIAKLWISLRYLMGSLNTEKTK